MKDEWGEYLREDMGISLTQWISWVVYGGKLVRRESLATSKGDKDTEDSKLRTEPIKAVPCERIGRN